MKYDKYGLRLTQCIQIDTSNTALNESDLDFSLGATIPQYSKVIQHIFADDDIMYSQSFDPNELEEQDVEQVNSRETATNIQGLLAE